MTSLYMKLKLDQLLKYNILYSSLYLHFLSSFCINCKFLRLVNVYIIIIIFLGSTDISTFENVESSMSQLESLVIRTFFDWSRARGLTNSNCLLDFKGSLDFCAYFFVLVILLGYFVPIIVCTK